MAGYLGDIKTKIVHHLAFMKNECDIYHIEKKDKQYFTPDLLTTAQNLGFTPCEFCVSNEDCD